MQDFEPVPNLRTILSYGISKGKNVTVVIKDESEPALSVSDEKSGEKVGQVAL